jgi:hypothetical protein
MYVEAKDLTKGTDVKLCITTVKGMRGERLNREKVAI